MGLTPVKFSDEKLFKPMNKAMCEMLPKLQHGWEEEVLSDGRKIISHSYAGISKGELELMKKELPNGATARMLPKLQTSESAVFSKFGNPDAIVGGNIWELKQQVGDKTKRFFQNHFEKATEYQMGKVVVFELKNLDWNIIENQLRNRWKTNPDILIIRSGDNSYRLKKDTWGEQIKSIKKALQ